MAILISVSEWEKCDFINGKVEVSLEGSVIFLEKKVPLFLQPLYGIVYFLA